MNDEASTKHVGFSESDDPINFHELFGIGLAGGNASLGLRPVDDEASMRHVGFGKRATPNTFRSFRNPTSSLALSTTSCVMNNSADAFFQAAPPWLRLRPAVLSSGNFRIPSRPSLCIASRLLGTDFCAYRPFDGASAESLGSGFVT